MTPYYQDDLVTLYHGRFEEVLRQLGPIGADAVVTDPPYGETSLKWDRWPVGWPAVAAKHVQSMWVFGSMRMFLDRRHEFDGWKLSQDVVWKDRFKRVHEHALHWYRGKWGDVHHETPTTPDATPRAVRRKERPPHMGAIENSTYVSVDGGPRLMRSVLFRRSMHGRAINETEKPVDLITPLVAYAVPPGGLVLDLFAGSASTLVAARDSGRRAIGIEMRESQCEKAARRLATATTVSDPGSPGSAVATG